MANEASRIFSMTVGADENSFISLFEREWEDHLTSFPIRYQTARQLQIGSRFRPLLVAWGYLLSGDNFEQSSRTSVAKLAVYIELLHKATLLVDDLIDEDDWRRGEPAFHREYSSTETILFAVYLLGDSLSRLSASTKLSCQKDQHFEMVELLCSAIKKMANGGISEVCSSTSDLLSVPAVRKIIELQTVELIKNGLLMGYKFGNGEPSHDSTIDKLGYDCGYLFQVLNDLESFGDKSPGAEQKKAGLVDTSRSRKNIVAARIYESLSPAERNKFLSMATAPDPQFVISMSNWLLSRGILDELVDNLSHVNDSIQDSINSLPISNERKAGFRSFVDLVLNEAIRRVSNNYGAKLSKILIP